MFCAQQRSQDLGYSGLYIFMMISITQPTQKENTPTTTFAAHVSPITGIDWCPSANNTVLTCSQDKQVKVTNTNKILPFYSILIKIWNLASTKSPIQTILVGVPVAQALYTVETNLMRIEFKSFIFTATWNRNCDVGQSD